MNRTPQPAAAAAEAAAQLPIDELPLPYLEIDARGVVTRANHAALAMHPPDQGDLLGQVAFALLAGGDREQSRQSFTEALTSRDEELPAVIRYLYDRSGKFAAYRLHRRVMRDEEGNPIGLRILGVNVSAFTEALDEARRRSLWLESIVHSLRDAMVVTDATGVIAGANPAAERLLGWKETELIGGILEERIHLRCLQSAGVRSLAFADALASLWHDDCTLIDRQGVEIPVQVSSAPLLDQPTGSVAGLVLTLIRAESSPAA